MKKQKLTSLGILFASISAMVGSGWLFGPLFAAKMAGPAATLSWLIGGCLVCVVAFTFAELTTALPLSGGISAYGFFTHGHMFGFLMGWVLWVSLVFTIPIEVLAAIQYASNYLPWLMSNENGFAHLSFAGFCGATLIMGVLSIVNAISVKAMSSANNWVTVWKLLVPAGIACAYIGSAPQGLGNLMGTHGGFLPYGFKGVLSAIAVSGVVYSFNGFQYGLMLAGEVENPKKSIPIAAIGSILGCIVLYGFLQLGFVIAIPQESLTDGWAHLSFVGDAGPLVGLAALLGLTWVVHVIFADAVISPLGSGLVQTASASRILYSMGVSGALPSWFAWLNQGKIPLRAIGFNFFIGMLFFLPFSSLQGMLGMLSTVLTLTFLPGPVCMYALRHIQPQLKRPFSLRAHKVWCFLAFWICTLLLYWSGFSVMWKITGIVVLGAGIFAGGRFVRLKKSGLSPQLNLVHSAWLGGYLLGCTFLSYLGPYENGRGVMPFGFDFFILGIFSSCFLELSKLSALKSLESQDNVKVYFNSKPQEAT